MDEKRLKQIRDIASGLSGHLGRLRDLRDLLVAYDDCREQRAVAKFVEEGVVGRERGAVRHG